MLTLSVPGDWVHTLPPVLALGPAAAPELERCLRQHPRGPGRQAAIAALGELGCRQVVPFLVELLDGPEEVAVEAALALGRLGDDDAAGALRRATGDPGREAVARTAAAGALLDLGDRAGTPLLCAVLLAGTPAGRELERAHDLPSKPRWALERLIAIDALARHTGGETFGLDPDASWPRLAAGVAAFQSWLAEHAPPHRQG